MLEYNLESILYIQNTIAQMIDYVDSLSISTDMDLPEEYFKSLLDREIATLNMYKVGGISE